MKPRFLFLFLFLLAPRSHAATETIAKTKGKRITLKQLKEGR